MSRYTRMAATDKQEQAIQTIEKVLKRINKTIVGGTTVGKAPQSVVLDLTYQGCEIYVDSDGSIQYQQVKVERPAEIIELIKGGL